ncbi:MAG: hypothetical protein KGH72_00540 [Candidatus Micrarchaeota archaeon]|nr:hypothetical protein [Candidatus Micrarchaeota archaeon]
MPVAKIEFKIDKPKECINILKEGWHRNRSIRMKASGDGILVTLRADTTKELLSSTEGLVKRLMVLSNTLDAIKSLE